MALRKREQAAAKLGEAFAIAQPQSPYAPQMLDSASKLLASTDPPKSQQLRELFEAKIPRRPAQSGIEFDHPLGGLNIQLLHQRVVPVGQFRSAVARRRLRSLAHACNWIFASVMILSAIGNGGHPFCQSVFSNRRAVGQSDFARWFHEQVFYQTL